MAEDEPDRSQPSLALPSLFRRNQTPPSLPRVPPWLAAGMTGVAVGLGVFGLTLLALRGCESVRGTSSCGGAGVLLLVGIFVVVMVGSRALLALLQVPEATSTAVLGTSFVAVVGLWFGNSVDDVVSLSLAGALAFSVARWVTSTFTEPGDQPR